MTLLSPDPQEYRPPKWYKGRVEITREMLASLLGMPQGVDVDIYYEPTKDTYNIIMRSREFVSVNGEPITFDVQEGAIIPCVDGTFMQRTLIVEEDFDIDESFLQNAASIRSHNQ